MAGGILQTLSQIILPKGKPKTGGTGWTPSFNPFFDRKALPQYREHQADLYSDRQQYDANTLLGGRLGTAGLVVTDPDISAAIHAYLTIAASANVRIVAYDVNGVIDPQGIQLANQLIQAMTMPMDYTIGYNNRPSQMQLLDDLRFSCLLRGQIAAELVYNKQLQPNEIRLVDPAQLLWFEDVVGRYTPQQKPATSATYIDLDIPTFFVVNFHQNPMTPFAYSPFVSAINTIAARTEVINELYRIMQVVGFPRMDITVMEQVLLQNAPPNLRSDPVAARQFVEGEISKIKAIYGQGLHSDQPLIHSDSVQTKIINEKNPGAGLQIQQVIDVLDAQNQAALKVMPAVIGKSNNLTTASVEARLFAMSADALNRTVADALSQMLTFASRMAGYPGRVEFGFDKVEMRPELELEPQKIMRATRLKEDLSLGIISDEEYTMAVYGRTPNDGAPELSGTGFMQNGAASTGTEVDVANVSPNSDPLGRAMVPDGAKSAKSNAVTKSQPQAAKGKPGPNAKK